MNVKPQTRLYIFAKWFGLFVFVMFCGDAKSALIRQPNTTLSLPQNPQGTGFSYTVNEAMDGLEFNKPVGFGVEPGATNRLFVVERTGRIIVVTNLAAPTRTVFLDITNKVYSDYELGYCEGLSSVAFHPGYATNRFFYVTYTLRSNIAGVWKNYNRLSRFQRSPTNLNQALPTSEVPFITQFDEGNGHNMNDLHFGTDGYLYCATGDEGDGGSGDEYNNAQRIDKDFFSGILRIDVDKRPGNPAPNPHPSATTNYAIPFDNPFVGATSFNGLPVVPTAVRTEFFAVGLRNVWRMSFDPVTGLLYAGDVGQYEREEINVVRKGENYGWAYRQGNVVGPKGDPPFGVNLTPPILEYHHGFGNDHGHAVAGGVVYRGSRMLELYGAYIFSDYVSGNVWMLRYDGTNATPFTRLCGESEIAGFGRDPRNGDILIVNHFGGKIGKLDYATAPTGNLPATLADTGAFADPTTLTPNAGIVPYEINVPFWSDNAKKHRWFSLPGENMKFTFNRDSHWDFPATTVWIKHFDLEMTNGIPQSAKRIETRFLVRNASGVYGVTYRWGNSTSNATLVPESGMDETFQINDGGSIRSQTWRYPSRNECLSCHTAVAGYALGFNTRQLNCDYDHGDGPVNQIRALADAGYFANAASVTNLWTLPHFAKANDTNVSREYRVRSYLAVNCVQCHQPGGVAQSHWDARITTPLSQCGIVNGALFNNGGNANNRVVKPGSLSESMLLTRIANLGPQHMPPLATSVLNADAIDLVQQWIQNDLAGYKTFSEWQLLHFGSTNAANASANADPDSDRTSNHLEYLLSRNPTNSSDGWKMSLTASATNTEISFFQKENRVFELQSASNLIPPIAWTPLDVAENQPYFSASDRTNVIHDKLTNGLKKFYRMKVSEP